MIQIHPEFESLNLLLLVGAGAEAKAAIDLLSHGFPEWNVAHVVDPDPAFHGQTCLEVPVVGGYEKLEHLVLSETKHAALCLGRRAPELGQEAIRRLQEEGIQLVSLIHSASISATQVELADGVTVMAGAVLGVGVSLGPGTFVAAGAVLEPEVTLGRCCYVGPGAVIEAGLTLGDGSSLETGSCLRAPAEPGGSPRLIGEGDLREGVSRDR